MHFHDLPEPDALGPVRVLQVYDPETGMTGFSVVDSEAFGPGTGGGVRFAPDVSVGEVARLARAMTYKFDALGLPFGGAKSGIVGDPAISGETRARTMHAFGRGIRPLYEAGMRVGADMGTDQEDVALMLEGAGQSVSRDGLSMRMKDGEALENHATGYGVAVSAKAAAEFAGLPLKGASVAIEGFGKVAGGVARYLTQMGARIVALSTVLGGRYDPAGLDVEALLAARATLGDRAVTEHARGDAIGPADLFALPVDILIPGARPYVLSEANAGRVRAKIVTSIANIPLTEEAETILHDAGTLVVPDFVSNGGGVVLAFLDWLGADEAQLFASLDRALGGTTRTALEAGRQQGCPPSQAMRTRTQARIAAARANPNPADEATVMAAAKARFLG